MQLSVRARGSEIQPEEMVRSKHVHSCVVLGMSEPFLGGFRLQCMTGAISADGPSRPVSSSKMIATAAERPLAAGRDRPV